jgi:hypothetical protein
MTDERLKELQGYDPRFVSCTDWDEALEAIAELKASIASAAEAVRADRIKIKALVIRVLGDAGLSDDANEWPEIVNDEIDKMPLL